MKLSKVVAVAALAVLSTQALAWGDREQGALAGAAAILLGQHILNNHNHQHYAPPPPVYREVPVYVQPAPVYVQPAPVIVPPTYTPIPGGYMDICRYRNQEIRIYDSLGNVIGWRYCN